MTSDVFMIGGANGAGKTTEAMTLLPKFLTDVFEFVNADEIARGLNPVKPETANVMAGKIMINRIDALIASKKNFAFETMCALHHHVHTFQKCKQAGYRLNLIFLWLPSPEMAVHRVVQRIKQGGHAIPEDIIRRRYINGLRNLVKTYLPMAEKALIIDNSGKALIGNTSSTVIAEKIENEFFVTDQDAWRQIESIAKGNDND